MADSVFKPPEPRTQLAPRPPTSPPAASATAPQDRRALVIALSSLIIVIGLAAAFAWLGRRDEVRHLAKPPDKIPVPLIAADVLLPAEVEFLGGQLAAEELTHENRRTRQLNTEIAPERRVLWRSTAGFLASACIENPAALLSLIPATHATLSSVESTSLLGVANSLSLMISIDQGGRSLRGRSDCSSLAASLVSRAAR